MVIVSGRRDNFETDVEGNNSFVILGFKKKILYLLPYLNEVTCFKNVSYNIEGNDMEAHNCDFHVIFNLLKSEVN